MAEPKQLNIAREKSHNLLTKVTLNTTLKPQTEVNTHLDSIFLLSFLSQSPR